MQTILKTSCVPVSSLGTTSINRTFTFFVFFGDFNGDGAVNAADWLLFAPYFNTSVRSNNWFMDGNDDGDINGADYLLFIAHFNQSAAGSYSGPIAWNGQPQQDLYYSSNWQVLEEDTTPTSGGSSYVSDQYVWGLAYVDEMVLRDSVNSGGGNYGISGSGLDQRLYAIQDANWNTTGLIVPGGTVEQNFIYDPYGNDTPVNANATSPVTDAYNWIYLHQGGRLDPVTNLYSFRHRDYSPTLGRWTQCDEYTQSADLYLYETDDPAEFLDGQGTWSGPPNGTLTTTLTGISGTLTRQWTTYSSPITGASLTLTYSPGKGPGCCQKPQWAQWVYIQIIAADPADYTTIAVHETKEHNGNDPTLGYVGDNGQLQTNPFSDYPSVPMVQIHGFVHEIKKFRTKLYCGGNDSGVAVHWQVDLYMFPEMFPITKSAVYESQISGN